MTDIITRTVTQLRHSLRTALPSRVIADYFVNHSERRTDDLKQGVVTLLVPAVTLEEWHLQVRLTLVAQISVAERETTPADTEQAELLLLAELRRWARNPGTALPHLAVNEVRLSSQLEHPHGWVAMDITSGLLDDTDSDELYPPTVEIGRFDRAHIDIDIPPHETRTEYNKWLQGDYSTSQPDLDMEINHGHDQP